MAYSISRVFNPQQIEMDQLRTDSEQLALMDNISSMARKARAIQLLRQFSAPLTVAGVGKPIEDGAMSAAYSAGYNQAITDIQYFRQLFVDIPVEVKTPRALFGGPEIALLKNDLLPGEG